MVMIIETFEQELVKCDEREKEQQRKYEEVEREIEDHFAKCESALAARKVFLLNECSNHLSTQSMLLYIYSTKHVANDKTTSPPII